MYLISWQLLAGANVHDVDNHQQNALHMAASGDHASIATVLIENGIDVDAADDNQNNGKFKMFNLQEYFYPLYPSCLFKAIWFYCRIFRMRMLL